MKQYIQIILVSFNVDKKYMGILTNVRPVGAFANLGRFDLWMFCCKIVKAVRLQTVS